MRVSVFAGTRPELIRLAAIVQRLDSICEVDYIYTGQNFSPELSGEIIKDLGGVTPNRFFNLLEGDGAARICHLMELARIYFSERLPKCCLLLGDTDSCLVSLIAKKCGVPVVHLEAGNRCFDLEVPEEVNRRIVDTISDINICYSTRAAANLAQQNFPPDKTFVVGSPMYEVIEKFRKPSRVLEDLGLTGKRYVVVSCHRAESVDQPDFPQFYGQLLRKLSKECDRVIAPIHPRIKRLIDLSEGTSGRVIFVPPFNFSDYLSLQESAYCVISDSGTINEESAILGFPALNMRDTFERQESMDHGITLLIGKRPDQNNIWGLVEKSRVLSASRPSQMPEEYFRSNVSAAVANIVLSYADYVGRKQLR